MSPETRRHAKELFIALEELSVDERDARLADCENLEVRQAVRELLAAARRADQVFEVAEAPAGDLPGRRIGPYEVEELLGRGGMGAVWRAKRVDGEFEQQVAIKVLTAAGFSEDAHQRFIAEREILARLTHTNIARIFDGGVMESGEPYFVMEYVDGQHIDSYCDRSALGVDERLRLFIQVCRAVAHAHARGIVHRDIKPANVLVTAEGEIKLLDFGIAKLVDENVGITRFETKTGMTPMTPAYASPEQLRSEPVTTATDVYSLGVLLYLLLTGDLPYTSTDESPLALGLAICENPVPRPSDRFTTRQRPTRQGSARQGSTQESADKGTTPDTRRPSDSALHRRIRGDVDTITLKALRKEPHRRYLDAADLGDDLHRHLEHFPIHARGESRTYRATRFFKRHRVATRIGAAAIVTVAVSVGLTVRLAGSNFAKEREVTEARSENHQLLDQLLGLYRSADPWSPSAGTETRPLLDAATRSLRAAPPRNAEVHATLLTAAGKVYVRLAEFDEASELLREAVGIRRTLSPEPNLPLADALFHLGTATGRGGNPAAGQALLREALEIELSLRGEDHLNVGRIRYGLASAAHDGTGDAEHNFQEALRIFRAHGDQPTEAHGQALHSRAEFLAVMGQLDEAIEASVEALEVWRKLFGQDHAAYAKTAEGLGMIYCKVDRKDEGIVLLQQALKVNRRVYGSAGHPNLAWSLLNLGGTLAWNGDESGVAMTQEAIDMYRRLPSTDLSVLGFALTSQGRILAQRDPASAIATFEEALQVFEDAAVSHGRRLVAQEGLADALLEEGETGRALELLRAVAATHAAQRGEGHERTIAVRARIESLEFAGPTPAK